MKLEIEPEQIKKALDEAYKEAGSNAYFGNGFEAGVKFATDFYISLGKPDINKGLKVSKIESIIINEFGFSFAQLAIKSRGGKELLPRQVTMYLLHKYSSLNQNEIGELFNRDHATVRHSQRTVINLIETDKGIESIVLKIEKEI